MYRKQLVCVAVSSSSFVAQTVSLCIDFGRKLTVFGTLTKRNELRDYEPVFCSFVPQTVSLCIDFGRKLTVFGTLTKRNELRDYEPVFCSFVEQTVSLCFRNRTSYRWEIFHANLFNL